MYQFAVKNISIPQVQFKGGTGSCTSPTSYHFNSTGPIQGQNVVDAFGGQAGFQFHRSNSRIHRKGEGWTVGNISIPQVQFKGLPPRSALPVQLVFQFHRSNSRVIGIAETFDQSEISIPQVQFKELFTMPTKS